MLTLAKQCAVLTIGAAAWTINASFAANHCQPIPENYFLKEAAVQAKAVDVDYRKELAGALNKDARALQKLLRVTAAMALDGAGAQYHSDVLWNLLQCWGDKAFSMILSRQSKKVRMAVIHQLDYATDEIEKYEDTYPLTHAAGTRKR